MKFGNGEKLRIKADVIYVRESLTDGQIVVKFPGDRGVVVPVPINSVKRIPPNFEPGLVIRITSGFLSRYVAMRTMEMWHFNVDRDAVWTDEAMLARMEEYGYEVIYDPSEKE